MFAEPEVIVKLASFLANIAQFDLKDSPFYVAMSTASHAGPECIRNFATVFDAAWNPCGKQMMALAVHGALFDDEHSSFAAEVEGVNKHVRHVETLVGARTTCVIEWRSNTSHVSGELLKDLRTSMGDIRNLDVLVKDRDLWNRAWNYLLNSLETTPMAQCIDNLKMIVSHVNIDCKIKYIKPTAETDPIVANVSDGTNKPDIKFSALATVFDNAPIVVPEVKHTDGQVIEKSFAVSMKLPSKVPQEMSEHILKAITTPKQTDIGYSYLTILKSKSEKSLGKQLWQLKRNHWLC